MTKRRVEITIECERVVVGRRKLSVMDRCDSCGARVQMILPDAAAKIMGITERTVYRLVEAGMLHFREERHLGLLVCVESISNSQEFVD